MKKTSLLFAITMLFSLMVQAQHDLYMPLNIQKAYENGSRDLSGEPGVKYWQNKAEYDMQVKLDPALSKIIGSESIVYTNNSPDTLNEIVISLLADIFKKGNPNDFGIPLTSLNEGVIISRLELEGEIIDLSGAAINRRGTNLVLQVSPVLDGVLPGKKNRAED